jgi:hypothetical protein
LLAAVVLAAGIEAAAGVLVDFSQDRLQFLLGLATQLLLERQGQVMEAHLLQVETVVLLNLEVW